MLEELKEKPISLLRDAKYNFLLRGQFHQHFTRGFYCTKVLSEAFLHLNFRFELFFGARILAQMRS
jgi:hypothetical protein